MFSPRATPPTRTSSRASSGVETEAFDPGSGLPAGSLSFSSDHEADDAGEDQVDRGPVAPTRCRGPAPVMISDVVPAKADTKMLNEIDRPP